MELETSKQWGKENLQQAILNEKDRYTKMQWDAQDFKRKCMELEQKLKSEQVWFFMKSLSFLFDLLKVGP